jgi:hypothetical protein
MKLHHLLTVIPVVVLTLACGSSTPPSATPEPGTESEDEPATSSESAPADEPAAAPADSATGPSEDGEPGITTE